MAPQGLFQGGSPRRVRTTGHRCCQFAVAGSPRAGYPSLSSSPGSSTMRLATIQTADGPRAAVLHGLHYVDLHATDPRLPAGVRPLLELGPPGLELARQTARRSDAVRHEASRVRLLAPVPDPRKI